MKKISTYGAGLIFAAMSLALGACSEFEPTGYPEVPYLAKADNVTAEVTRRTVQLAWSLPVREDITGVIVRTPNGSLIDLDASATSCTLKGQPMKDDLVYSVKIKYDGGYVSEGSSVTVSIPYVAPKMAYLLTASKPEALPDDDERAAAAWFAAQENAMFIQPDQIADVDPDVCPVIWVEIDREGLPAGWENLPAEISDPKVIKALKDFSANGGSLYLSNMATQLTVPLGIVPDNMAPTVFSSGAGGDGTDIWTINPYLGWQFKEEKDAEQGFYDRTFHAIYKGLTFEKLNDYPYESLPLIGPGHREDHNTLWDCNIYGKGSYRDVIANFEHLTNSLVLATWGHVRDHCVAGLVEFYATSSHGSCVANGFAAYEWSQNPGPNPYQNNIERLTANILNYLKEN